MNRYLSHFSAAEFWEIPCLHVIAERLPAGMEDNTHFTYTNPQNVWQRKGIFSHSCKLPLPTGSIVSKNGIKLASPELVFIQLANKLDIQSLILLGLQLCSHPPGKPTDAITTKAKLKKLIDRTKGHRGHKKAQRAFSYIEDGSASIMESLAYMILNLPNSLGGYGLKGAVFNHEIKLNKELGKRLGQSRCFVDLYYKEAKLAVEYDSFAFHNSPLDHGRDSIRSEILKRQGIEVLSMSTIQLYDQKACEDFAYNLASRIGERVQIRTQEFKPMHEELRKLLPAK